MSTLVFADLAGYTAVTEAHGDEEAADLAAAFYGRDVREPVDLLSVECDKPMAELVRDPVCHMLLEPSRATEHLGREGVDHSFLLIGVPPRFRGRSERLRRERALARARNSEPLHSLR